MRIVILGSGRVGTRLANGLVDQGHTILVVDEKVRKFKPLKEHPDIHRIHGNIMDEKVSDATFSQITDVFVVVTGSDNVNVMAAQAMYKKYQIKRVLVRIFDPDIAEVYKTLGLEVVCPTNYAVTALNDILKQKGRS